MARRSEVLAGAATPSAILSRSAVAVLEKACAVVVTVYPRNTDGGHMLLQGSGRKAVGLGSLEIVAHVEGTDVLHALLTAALEEGEETSPAPARRLSGCFHCRWRRAGSARCGHGPCGQSHQ